MVHKWTETVHDQIDSRLILSWGDFFGIWFQVPLTWKLQEKEVNDIIPWHSEIRNLKKLKNNKLFNEAPFQTSLLQFRSLIYRFKRKESSNAIL